MFVGWNWVFVVLFNETNTYWGIVTVPGFLASQGGPHARVKIADVPPHPVLHQTTGGTCSSCLCVYPRRCKTSSVGRFRLKPDTSNSHEFELHRPSNKGTKLLLKVIKAIIIIRGRDCQSRGRRFDSGNNSENRELKSIWIWVLYLSIKGTKLLFQVIKAIINQFVPLGLLGL